MPEEQKPEFPTYYFAYGSNMDQVRFGGRIWRMIEDDEIQHGVLEGYQLVFNKPSKCTIENCPQKVAEVNVKVAKANIQKNDSAEVATEVEGLIFTINNVKELTRLRASEGYKPSRSKKQNDYDEIKMNIKTNEGDKECFVYVACKNKSDLPVERYYFNHILKGKSVLNLKGKPLLSECYCKILDDLYADLHAKTNMHECPEY